MTGFCCLSVAEFGNEQLPQSVLFKFIFVKICASSKQNADWGNVEGEN